MLHDCQPSCREERPLQEKVVLPASHPDQRLLHPGDFYRLAPPPSLACSASPHSPLVEQQQVSGVALYSLYTVAWLETLNKQRGAQRGAQRLEKCVVSTREDIARILREDLVQLQSCDPPRAPLQVVPSSRTHLSASSSEGEESEGEYVELMEDVQFPRFGPQRGSLTQNLLLQNRAKYHTHTHGPLHITHTPHTIHPSPTSHAPHPGASNPVPPHTSHAPHPGPPHHGPSHSGPSHTSHASHPGPPHPGPPHSTHAPHPGPSHPGPLHTSHNPHPGPSHSVPSHSGPSHSGPSHTTLSPSSVPSHTSHAPDPGPSHPGPSHSTHAPHPGPSCEAPPLTSHAPHPGPVHTSHNPHPGPSHSGPSHTGPSHTSHNPYPGPSHTSHNPYPGPSHSGPSHTTLSPHSVPSHTSHAPHPGPSCEAPSHTSHAPHPGPSHSGPFHTSHASHPGPPLTSHAPLTAVPCHIPYSEKTSTPVEHDSGDVSPPHPSPPVSPPPPPPPHQTSHSPLLLNISTTQTELAPHNTVTLRNTEARCRLTHTPLAPPAPIREPAPHPSHVPPPDHTAPASSFTSHVTHTFHKITHKTTHSLHATPSRSKRQRHTDPSPHPERPTSSPHPALTHHPPREEPITPPDHEHSAAAAGGVETSQEGTKNQSLSREGEPREKMEEELRVGEDQVLVGTDVEKKATEKVALEEKVGDLVETEGDERDDGEKEREEGTVEEVCGISKVQQGPTEEEEEKKMGGSGPTLAPQCVQDSSGGSHADASSNTPDLCLERKGVISGNRVTSSQSDVETESSATFNLPDRQTSLDLYCENPSFQDSAPKGNGSSPCGATSCENAASTTCSEEPSSSADTRREEKSELQNKGSSSELPRPGSDHVTEGPERLGPSRAETVPDRSAGLLELCKSDFFKALLSSGAICLPGARDRRGRVLLTVQGAHHVWSHPACESLQVLRLLEYCTATVRKEVLAAGLTVLVDGRQAPPPSSVFHALGSLQERVPASLHTVLLRSHDALLHLDEAAVPEQVEVLHSLKSLHRLVEPQRLPVEFGGSLRFSQRSWIIFRMRVERLTAQCEEVIQLLQKTIHLLEAAPAPPTAEEAQQLLSRYNTLMCEALGDGRLVSLQQDGGALLSQLRREETCASEDGRATLEKTSSLYERVDELLHRLVTLSNGKTQQIKFILEFWSLQPGFLQVRSWLNEVGEPRLKSLEEAEDSLDQMVKKHQEFKEFCSAVHDQCQQGQELLRRLQRFSDVSSSNLQRYEVQVRSFWSRLQSFCQRLSAAGRTIERTVALQRFFDQAYGWSLEGMRHLASVSMEDCSLPDKCQAVMDGLEEYRRQHPPILDARFQEMKAAAEELRGPRGLSQWSFAWSKCQETKKMFDRKMEAAMRTRALAQRRPSDSAHSLTSDSAHSLSPDPTRRLSDAAPRPPPESPQVSASRRMLSGLRGVLERIPSLPEHERAEHTPLLRRLLRASSEEASLCSSTLSLNSSSSSSSCSVTPSRRQNLRKTQSFDCPPTPDPARYLPCPRALSEPARRGNTGVFIRGLEVSSTEAADRTLCPRSGAHSWAAQGPHSPRTPGTPRTTGTSADLRPRGSKLRHIVDEMVSTEREYVRSLHYIVENYFPEVERDDVPQDLRGKRSVVFGNLEKLLDFHQQFFLRELEVCQKHPLRVSHCFLRHAEQFSLYALYSKNKPKSDALLASHGLFFQRKQRELADKMDLSSYLLKPIQRMSKYALLLADIIKEVGVGQEAELPALQAASDMVKFQLRHGNDLLAMDAIRHCDVNLKEQGQLLRQDEFTVWTGRKKCQRHVFLFEELLLLSKPKKMEGGLDVFHYKHSFKTADLGLTESTGKDGLAFEIWFRKRTVKNQTLVLQAGSSELKLSWTSEIQRILWTQAARNKEMRLKEMVSMGVGSKPFLDIKPSDAAISDRAVHCIVRGRAARTRASIAVSAFDHAHPFQHSPVTSDPQGPRPSSSSLLGPLNLHLYSQSLPASPASFANEADETGSQPSITTESSGSSSRGLSGSTGSDSGCVSSHLPEPIPEESVGSAPLAARHKPLHMFSPTTFV